MALSLFLPGLGFVLKPFTFIVWLQGVYPASIAEAARLAIGDHFVCSVGSFPDLKILVYGFQKHFGKSEGLGRILVIDQAMPVSGNDTLQNILNAGVGVNARVEAVNVLKLQGVVSGRKDPFIIDPDQAVSVGLLPDLGHAILRAILFHPSSSGIGSVQPLKNSRWSQPRPERAGTAAPARGATRCSVDTTHAS
jgi:hypothetical protein